MLLFYGKLFRSSKSHLKNMSLVPLSCSEILLVIWELEFYLNVHLRFLGLPCMYVSRNLCFFSFLNVYQKDVM